MMRSFVIKNRRLIKNPSQKQIQKYLKDKKAAVWIDMQKPTDAEYKFLEQTFRFHPLSIEDCKKEIELPKIDMFEDYLFIVIYTPVADFEKLKLNTKELDFFLGNNYVVTVHNTPSESIEREIEKIVNTKNGISISADFIMYEIIDHSVDVYFPLLDKWEDHIEQLEEEIIQQKHPKNTLKIILSIKKEVLNFRKSVAPQMEVMNKFSKKEFPFIKPRTNLYFKDVFDHLTRIYSQVETLRDLLRNAFDAHTTMISKQMTETSNRMNEVMQKLTIIATIFMPLTFITGVYGMNFRHMPELYWKYGYYFILAIMMGIGAMMFWFFKKRRWT